MFIGDILGQMQRVALSPIAVVSSGVYVGVCVCHVGGSHENGFR